MLLVFDDCVLDLDRRELRRAEVAVAIPPKVFDLLAYLACQRERVVSRTDLIDSVWDGRIVSESTLASHINAVRKAVGDDGQQQRVIRTMARKGFRFTATVQVTDAKTGTGRRDSESRQLPDTAVLPLLLPDKPSIAVLPFLNLSGDREKDYLADGVVEDIIAALSRYRWLFVVARNSSFTYKNRNVDIKQIGRELGVRYVLEGSWRNAQNHFRVTGQLIEAATGGHLWADRFEGVMGDIFKFQDQMTESVVGAIAPQLEQAEIARARHKATESLDAYDHYLRGMAQLQAGTRDSIRQALPLFQLAQEADPEFASAYAMAGWCYCWRKVNRWMDDPSLEYAEGVRLARRAVELGKNDAVALTRGGHTLAHLAGDFHGGIALLDKALLLNPNLAAAWFLGAYLRLWHGETTSSITYFERAMRLSPLDPELYRMQAGMAAAHLFERHYDEAKAWAEKAFRELPSFLLVAVVLAACHALSESVSDAQRAMDHVRKLAPDLRLSNITDWLPIHNTENLAILVDGLRKAGLPD